MLYSDSITILPLQWVALFFGKFLLTGCRLDQQTFSDISSDARFKLYKVFAVLTVYKFFASLKTI